MEPVLLICGGCGVRIRTADPAKARDRACPRCESSLSPAVDRALGVVPLSLTLVDPVAVPAKRPRPFVLATGLIVALMAIAGMVSLASRDSSPTPSHNPGRLSKPVVWSRQAPPPPSIATPEVATPTPTTDEVERPEPPSSVAELTPPPPTPENNLAILDPADRDPKPIFKRPTPPTPRSTTIDQSPPPPPSASSPVEVGPAEPRRLLVRDPKGRAIVTREHGMVKDRLAVVLPDGQIGWPDGQVVTHDPFVPATMEEMKQALIEDPEFASFRLLQTAHYLILFQGKTDTFAKASGELLERLHDGLTGALRKNGLPVKTMEFPLVAVIFETEADFRADRKVPPDVQACYETLSNRIYFYEKSRRDQDSPEVALLRKPQTVAHEGTHQILHNVGIQPRMSDWPLWLVEGLAEYCSPPKFSKKGGVDWAGLGQVNPMHMATIRDLDDPLPNQYQGASRQPIAARDRRTPLVEYLVTRKELTPTDYALAWALTHYLATRRTDDFVEYVKRMSKMTPGQELTPAEQLSTFREVFGHDLAQMDGKVATHLKKVKQPDVLPFYAVIFQQEVGAMVHRQAMVSQSPSVIRQWIESVTHPQGAEPHWQSFQHLTRKSAIEAVDQWMRNGN